jgi:hypothetical protein
MKNNTFAIIAIAAVAALLIATTAVSTLTNQAYATTRMNAAQSCVNENVRCQNIQNQLQGQDNAGTVVGYQPITPPPM